VSQSLFVSNRNVTIASTLGAAIFFEKGIPTHVPRSMHGLVMEKGVLPCDKDGKALDVEKVVEEIEQETKVKSAPEDADERQDAITKVLRGIVASNKSSDFTAAGTPSAQAVSLSLGWKVDQKEVRLAWVKARPVLIGDKE
jgi:hypothetical protein